MDNSYLEDEDIPSNFDELLSQGSLWEERGSPPEFCDYCGKPLDKCKCTVDASFEQYYGDEFDSKGSHVDND